MRKCLAILDCVCVCLSLQVDQLVKDHAALQEKHAALSKAKTAADKRVKELGEKLRDDVDVSLQWEGTC